MRLILVDIWDEARRKFFPLALSRPLWELRCGITSLGDKLIRKAGARDVACFVPEYLAEAYRSRTDWPVNDASALAGDDLLIVNPLVKADTLDVATIGPSEVALCADETLQYARIAQVDLKKLTYDGIDSLLRSAKGFLPNVGCELAMWQYSWDLILANPDQITADFAVAGRSGIEGSVEQPMIIRGGKTDVFIASGATIHPMVVIDAEHGPVYIDEGVQIQPFSRVEGPCYIGKNSVLLGAKCREGNSIGPHCRIGGELEESVIQGYSNKYHDGFIGHAYIGEWVNLGALTTNSDLKNDYSNVSVMLDGRRSIDTGSRKVGSLIGDHAKTSIGTLFNTGSYVGAMAIIMATGKPLPKFIPSFAWFVEGIVTKGFGKGRLYDTARVAMSRRQGRWSQAEQDMWDAVFEMTAPVRAKAVKKGRRAMMSS